MSALLYCVVQFKRDRTSEPLQELLQECDDVPKIIKWNQSVDWRMGVSSRPHHVYYWAQLGSECLARRS